MSRIGETLREPFPGFPPPLTTRPEGLLSLLGIQNNGRYPESLATAQLQPNIDLLRWYLETVATFKTGTLALAGAGTFTTSANLTVPAGEHWIVLQFNVVSAGLVAAGAELQVGRTNSSGGTYVALGDASDANPNSYTHANLATWGQHYIARPSVELGVFELNGPGHNVNYTLRYARLQT